VARGEAPEDRWIEPADLLVIVRRDVTIQGDESPEDALMQEPNLLLPVSAPGTPPLDLATFRARNERWGRGEGPRLVGMTEFVSTLESLTTPARVVHVRGKQTTYAFIVDVECSRVLAAVAIDPPSDRSR
jgi:hypothetical protein